jgi:hypothetical protein
VISVDILLVYVEISPLENGGIEGDTPVHAQLISHLKTIESSCLGLQLKVGGKFHLKLNTGGRPIANKYREGKMQSTLKRELKVPEIAEREAKETSVFCSYINLSLVEDEL